MAKSKTGLIATGLTVVSFLFLLLAFSTPYWLETDGSMDDPKFEKIGLWEVCFKNFRDPHFWYDTTFGNCWWIFEEEYYIIYDFLLPGFFVAVQFFFTVCFLLTLISLIASALYMICSRENEKFVFLQVFLGSMLIGAAFSGTLAVYIFGVNGDNRDWMPNWEHNNIGWSYALAVIGVIGNYASGILYLVEGKRHHKKINKLNNIHSAYQMEDRPYSTQSEI